MHVSLSPSEYWTHLPCSKTISYLPNFNLTGPVSNFRSSTEYTVSSRDDIFGREDDIFLFGGFLEERKDDRGNKGILVLRNSLCNHGDQQ